MDELSRIQQSALHARNLTISPLTDFKADTDTVKKSMNESSWIHFACHGIQDNIDPNKSGLHLAGTSVLTLSEIVQMSHSHTEFVFLSACQTATGVHKLSEESAHLAAGMMLAGYRSVIATMWSIEDRVAPDVAAQVYDYLLNGKPDHTRAARALHLAVQHLRETDKTKPFISWVPYIHIGA